MTVSMPGVSEQELLNAEFELEEETFLVDNSELRSSGRGVKFRNSPVLEDSDTRIAKFGDIVEGVPFPDGWLMVGRKRFLPKRLKGATILVKPGEVRLPEEACDGVAALHQHGGETASASSSRWPVGSAGSSGYSSAPVHASLSRSGHPAGDAGAPAAELRPDLAQPWARSTSVARQLPPQAGPAESRVSDLKECDLQQPGRLQSKMVSLAARRQAAANLQAPPALRGRGAFSERAAGLAAARSRQSTQAAGAAAPLWASALDGGDEALCPKAVAVLYRVAAGLGVAPLYARPCSSDKLDVHLSGGGVVEVLGYDATRTWAQVQAHAPFGTPVAGWLRLQDDVVGPVLEQL